MYYVVVLCLYLCFVASSCFRNWKKKLWDENQKENVKKMNRINFNKEAARATINHALYYFIKKNSSFKKAYFFMNLMYQQHTQKKWAHKNHPNKKTWKLSLVKNVYRTKKYEKFTTNNTKKQTKQNIKKNMLKVQS